MPVDKKEEKTEFEQVWEQLWEQLRKTGSVCLDNPLAEVHDTDSVLRTDPFALRDYTKE